MLNGVEIYHEMSAAYTNYNVGEYEGFGRDVGVALALIFIGACNEDECEAPKQAMKSMIQEQLYPTGKGDDNSAYVAYLSQILADREEAEKEAAEHQNDTEDDIIAPIPDEDGDVFYDAKDHVELDNLIQLDGSENLFLY